MYVSLCELKENDMLRQGFVERVFSEFSVSDTLDLFQEMGLALTSRDGYVYPHSEQASSVLRILEEQMERLKVTCKYNAKVSGLRYDTQKKQWNVYVGDWAYKADRVILCCGSKAAPKTGSDGSGYALAGSVGHTICKVLPALTGLICKEPDIKGCAGARTKAGVRLEIKKAEGDNKNVTLSDQTPALINPLIEAGTAMDSGEIQWTDQGVSGIVIFQLSRIAARALAQGYHVSLYIDFLWGNVPGEQTLDRIDLLQKRMMSSNDALSPTLRQALEGVVNDRIASCILKRAGMDASRAANTLSQEERDQLIQLLSGFPLTVTGVRGFEQAQVCAGGVSLQEVRPDTLESRLAPGLYFAGEMLDVDGPCGGYNLQWAWSSGFVAGRAATGRADKSP